MSKRDFMQLIADGLTRDQIDPTSDLYYAVLAFDEYGASVRDNDFDGLVSLGRELDADDGGTP